MPSELNRIEWLERQLAQVNGFIARDREHLQAQPQKLTAQLSLDSWLTHQDELLKELATYNPAPQG